MARCELFVIAIFTVFVTVALREASALHCWHCNNGQQPFCDDPFDEDKMSEPQKFGSYAECPGGVLDRSVCIKMVTFKENEKKSITRMCAATPEAAKATCEARFKNDNEICETCDSDGCNGAAQYGPVALLTMIPVAIMKVLLL